MIIQAVSGFRVVQFSCFGDIASVSVRDQCEGYDLNCVENISYESGIFDWNTCVVFVCSFFFCRCLGVEFRTSVRIYVGDYKRVFWF